MEGVATCGNTGCVQLDASCRWHCFRHWVLLPGHLSLSRLLRCVRAPAALPGGAASCSGRWDTEWQCFTLGKGYYDDLGCVWVDTWNVEICWNMLKIFNGNLAEFEGLHLSRGGSPVIFRPLKLGRDKGVLLPKPLMSFLERLAQVWVTGSKNLSLENLFVVGCC